MSSKPMYFPPEPFNLADAVLCSDLVDLAYGMYEQWTNQGKPHTPADFHWSAPELANCQFGEPIWGNSSVLCLTDWEPFALTAVLGDKVYAIFRGTETLEDWYKDSECHQVAYELPGVNNIGLVHEGFFDLYQSLRDDLLRQLNQTAGTRQLLVTGHSLGAALAIVAMPDLLSNARLNKAAEIVQYNLAGPRTCDPALADYLNTGSAEIYRVVNSCDLVPDVPPSVYKGLDGTIVYQHVGCPVTFTAQYRGIAANHAHHDSYNYALKNPRQPQRAG